MVEGSNPFIIGNVPPADRTLFHMTLICLASNLLLSWQCPDHVQTIARPESLVYFYPNRMKIIPAIYKHDYT